MSARPVPPDVADVADVAAHEAAGRLATQQLARFEDERPRLLGLAYRLLGSLTDAEDVVQEAWIRWSGVDLDTIERPAAWLTTTVGRLGLDRLRARRRAQVDYVGPWLPEPLVRPMKLDDPADQAEVADSLTTAFLVLLERLSPEEWLVLLMADVFGEPFPVVADLVGRSPAATRQLAVRARRKLHDEAHGATLPTPSTAPREQLAVAAAFVSAVMNGDVATVRSLLHPDAVLTNDGGPHRHAARRPIVGADRVARFLVNLAKRLPPDVRLDPVWVNGSPGALVSIGDHPYTVHVLDVRDGLVARQYSVLNPDKLAAVRRSADLR